MSTSAVPSAVGAASPAASYPALLAPPTPGTPVRVNGQRASFRAVVRRGSWVVERDNDGGAWAVVAAETVRAGAADDAAPAAAAPAPGDQSWRARFRRMMIDEFRLIVVCVSYAILPSSHHCVFLARSCQLHRHRTGVVGQLCGAACETS